MVQNDNISLDDIAPEGGASWCQFPKTIRVRSRALTTKNLENSLDLDDICEHLCFACFETSEMLNVKMVAHVNFMLRRTVS